MINKSKKDILKSIKYKTKISNEIRTELLNKYSSGSYSTRKLSELYGISKSTIWNIVRKDN
jgi:transposase